jgi:hypothetical protein
MLQPALTVAYRAVANTLCSGSIYIDLMSKCRKGLFPVHLTEKSPKPIYAKCNTISLIIEVEKSISDVISILPGHLGATSGCPRHNRSNEKRQLLLHGSTFRVNMCVDTNRKSWSPHQSVASNSVGYVTSDQTSCGNVFRM